MNVQHPDFSSTHFSIEVPEEVMDELLAQLGIDPALCKIRFSDRIRKIQLKSQLAEMSKRKRRRMRGEFRGYWHDISSSHSKI